MIMVVSFWGQGDSHKVREAFIKVIEKRYTFLADSPTLRSKHDKLRCALAIVDLKKEEYDILTELATSLDEDAIVRWI